MKIIIKSYNGNDYMRFIKVLAGSDNQQDLRVAWELAWKLKQFSREIVLPCIDAVDAERFQNRLREAGAVCHAVQS